MFLKFGAPMAEQLVYKAHVLLASPSVNLYPFPIWNNKCKNSLKHVMIWCIHNRRASLEAG